MLQMDLLTPSTLQLRASALSCILDLVTNEGITASARNEAYGCIFGRDSAITILKLLNVYEKTQETQLLRICKTTLLTLVSLQGKDVNLESGEEPGKFVHEFRKDNYDRLIKRDRPWYVYADGFLRNYDSIDATPLVLIALFRYWKITKDTHFLLQIMQSVEAGLDWICTFADKDNDGLLEYELPLTRRSGGLEVQSWTDSFSSLVGIDGRFPVYPIAPIEVQAFAWLALKSWSKYYASEDRQMAEKLQRRAHFLKERFQEAFVFTDTDYQYGAQALDGKKNQIKTVTANPLLCLWATYTSETETESILPHAMKEDFVKRAFLPDLFDADCGIRTMSMLAHAFNGSTTSYHNGSFWPMLNGLIHEGLLQTGFTEHAEQLFNASMKPLVHFGTPIELFIKDNLGQYQEYQSPSGKRGCKYQAWSAAAALDMLTTYPSLSSL